MGFVYFIQAGQVGLIKIGFSANPYKRIAQLRTGSSDGLCMLGIAPAERQDETELHRMFAHARSSGEWFHATDELESFIAEACLTEQELSAFLSGEHSYRFQFAMKRLLQSRLQEEARVHLAHANEIERYLAFRSMEAA